MMMADAVSKLSMPNIKEPQSEKEANAAISELVKFAYAVIHAAEEIAEKHKTTFNFSLAYGMGGHYMPVSLAREEYDDPDYSEDEEGCGWVSSSRGC